MKKIVLALLIGCSPLIASAAGGGAEIPEHEWDFQGIRADWDKDQLLRGYTVGTQVCTACHSFKYISHRNLIGFGFSEKEAIALAAEMDKKLDDKLMSPLSAEDAQAVYGKTPPDLSMMNKARAHGADYTYALLTGYSEDEKKIKKYFPEGLPEGATYNDYFPGHAIAMPNPIIGDDMVEYHDDTPATVEQMAKDVTYFMQWTAEPELVKRKNTGVFVLIYLLFLSVLTYILKKKIWKRVKK